MGGVKKHYREKSLEVFNEQLLGKYVEHVRLLVKNLKLGSC